jgi:hypothetical protein
MEAAVMSVVEPPMPESPLESSSLPAITPSPVPAPLSRTPERAQLPLRQRLVRPAQIATARLQRLGVMGIGGVAALIFCATFVSSTLLPMHSRVLELRDAVEATGNAARHVRLPPPQEQAKKFVAGLPDRNSLPAVMGAIVEQAADAGLLLERGTYQWSAGKSGAIARYQVTLPVKGSYPAIRKFVDSTLAAVPAAALAGISLERPNVGDAQVAANLRFEIFVRSGP